jgi:hypothetical protein
MLDTAGTLGHRALDIANRGWRPHLAQDVASGMSNGRSPLNRLNSQLNSG